MPESMSPGQLFDCRIWLPDTKLLIYDDITLVRHSGGLRIQVAAVAATGADLRRAVLQLWTRTYDMHGEKIYEGDFISTKGYTIPMLIEWSPLSCGYVYCLYRADGRVHRTPLNADWATKTVHRMGNYYENPEMRKVTMP